MITSLMKSLNLTLMYGLTGGLFYFICEDFFLPYSFEKPKKTSVFLNYGSLIGCLIGVYADYLHVPLNKMLLNNKIVNKI